MSGFKYDANLGTSRREQRKVYRTQKKLLNYASKQIDKDIQEEVGKLDSDINGVSNNSVEGSGGEFNGKGSKINWKDAALTAGSAFDSITASKIDPNDSLGQQQNEVRNKISDAAIQSGNPIAMAIGVGSKVVDMIGAQTGLNIDNIDKQAGKDAGISGAASGFNNFMNYLPGNSMIWGAFAGKTQSADVISDEVKDVSGAYSDSYGDLESAQKLSNKRFLFGRKKANRFIEEANETNKKMQDISMANTYRKQSDYGNDIMQQNLNRYAGSNYMSNALAEHGMKLMSAEEARMILTLRRQATNVQAFEKGGQINVIPEGARHSRLNHLDDVHDDLSDVTKKGIPVVTPTQEGDLEQVAEVESGEIIFSKSVTDKLEELMKDGSDKAAIEAGKLLAKEIITNTDDKSEEYL